MGKKIAESGKCDAQLVNACQHEPYSRIRPKAAQKAFETSLKTLKKRRNASQK